MFGRKNKETLKVKKVENTYDKLKEFSMSAIDVLENLSVLSQDVVERNIEGDIVESGVYNGGSAAALGLPMINSARKLWLYDSFEGMPETTEKDGEFAKKYIGLSVGSEDKVKNALSIICYNDANIEIKKGWFNDTYKTKLPDKISILHVDCDWYDSVMLTLNTFYDKVSEGGVIIIDDYGHFEGCREALFDFLNKRNLKPLFERYGHTQIFWIKGRDHNRDYAGRDNKFSKKFHY